MQRSYYYFNKMGIITAAYGSYSVLCQNHNDKIMKNYAFVAATIDGSVRSFLCQRQHWFRYTLHLLLRRRRYCKHNSYSIAKALSLLLLLGGDVESNPGPSREWLRKQAKKQQYLLQREEILVKRRLDYAESPEPKRLASKAHYTANPEAKKCASKASYYADPEVKKAAAKAQYCADPKSKKAPAKAQYCADPESKKAAAKAQYCADPESKKAAAKAQYCADPEASE